MRDYSNGKIYKLVCSETNKIYIGSTIQPLNIRLRCHRCKGNTCVSKSFVNPSIQLLLDYPCDSKLELCKKETEYIKQYDCINNRPSVVSKEEKLARRRYRYHNNINDYQTKHKDDVKKRYEQNKEKLFERSLRKVTCECGSIQSYGNLSRHRKSKKHQDAIMRQNT